MPSSLIAPPSGRVGTRLSTLLRFVFFCLLGVCILFLLVEGLCSTLFVMHDFVSLSGRGRVPGSTQYDPELGWVNTPNFYSKDLHDPGVYVETNSKGFRNREEFEVQVPAGKLRVICSGDSFTFGIGVDNDHSWCQQLSALDHRLQTVNMGVAGYGVDQIYLMHLREGTQLNYDVQILAVIADDFKRMQNSNFLGYGKPMLELKGDRLAATHVPVRKTSGFSHWIVLHREFLSEFRSVAILHLLLGKPRPAPPAASNLPANATREVAARIIESLQATNHARKAVTVVVYLPTASEINAESSSGTWRGFLRDECAKRDVTFIDPLEGAQELPFSEAVKLHIPLGYHAAGHLTAYGNEYVARKIYQALTANPEISAKLSALR